MSKSVHSTQKYFRLQNDPLGEITNDRKETISLTLLTKMVSYIGGTDSPHIMKWEWRWLKKKDNQALYLLFIVENKPAFF